MPARHQFSHRAFLRLVTAWAAFCPLAPVLGGEGRVRGEEGIDECRMMNDECHSSFSSPSPQPTPPGGGGGGAESFALEMAAVPTSLPAPNLVRNGDFEKADSGNPRLPDGWTTKHPANVKYVKDSLDSARGMVIEMTGDKDLMGGYGVDLLSDRIAFRPNTRYRCTGATRSDGPNMIVFVKGYATIKGREEQIYQMRKEIKPGPQWKTFNLDFDVRPAKVFSDFQQKVEYLRITLWAYWPEGTCWYDDIRFEEVGLLNPEEVTNAEAVTHVGLKPHLATTQAIEEFDEAQVWADAVNAFQAGQDEQAMTLAAQLLSRQADNSDYRLLAARTLARQGKFSQSDEHARWLIDHAAQPWQREWATVVHAEAIWRGGHAPEAKQLLNRLIESATSENAKQAARDLLKRMDAAK